MVKVYCGSSDKIPKGRRRGSPAECFSIGRKVGFVAGIQTGEKQTKERLGRFTEAKSKLEMSMIKKQIKEKGLVGLKNIIHLQDLNKDELRAIAVRLHSTPQRIDRYWALNKNDLLQQLQNRGFFL